MAGISCRTCGGPLATCNLPVTHIRGAQSVEIMLLFYSCLQCGTCVTSVKEAGARGVLYAGTKIIKVVDDLPYRAGE